LIKQHFWIGAWKMRSLWSYLKGCTMMEAHIKSINSYMQFMGWNKLNVLGTFELIDSYKNKEWTNCIQPQFVLLYKWRSSHDHSVICGWPFTKRKRYYNVVVLTKEPRKGLWNFNARSSFSLQWNRVCLSTLSCVTTILKTMYTSY
jgi:hypothetical protein